MKPSATAEHCTILGVRFFSGTSSQAVELGVQGGLVVVPSAPALMEVVTNREYRDAANHADLVLTDSGFMVLIWRLLTGQRLPRTSGLRYLRMLFASPELREQRKLLWIMPSITAARRALRWLHSIGVSVSLDQFYIAPSYPAGTVEDPELLSFACEARPSHIFVGLGGGTQEKVGLYLKRNLDWRPGIHCIGAAIGFLSGDQVRIPDWADRCSLGWLFRCIAQPTRFLPRYWRSRKLGWLLWKYRDLSPAA